MEKKYLAVMLDHATNSIQYRYAGPFDTERECLEWSKENNKQSDSKWRWVVQQFTEEL